MQGGRTIPIIGDLIGSIVSSGQTSKAVNAIVGSLNTGIGNIQGAQTAGQNYITSATGQGQAGISQAVGGANDVLAGVNASEQSNLNPYLQLGQTGVNNLNTALAPGGSLTSQFSFDPTKIAQNPDYQFQLQQGTQAVQRAAAANGTLQGGGTMKALDQFSQGLASNEIGQSYNQALNTFNTNRANAYQSLALPLSLGQQATGQSQSAYQNYGNLTGQNLTQGAAQNANLGLTGANLNANMGYKGAQDITSLLAQIGQAKAGGSIAQGKIWSGFAQAATSPSSYVGLGGGGGSSAPGNTNWGDVANSAFGGG